MTLKFTRQDAQDHQPQLDNAEREGADTVSSPTPEPVEVESEQPDPESELAEEDGCPAETHLHVTSNRRFPLLPFMDIGPQLLSGKDPWNFSSHCPECGTLVQDRGNRRFRCSSPECEGRWVVPRGQVVSARKSAKSSPLGKEFVMLSGGG